MLTRDQSLVLFACGAAHDTTDLWYCLLATTRPISGRDDNGNVKLKGVEADLW